MSGRTGRFLVLTGSGLSFIVFGLALIVHNTLYHKDLERAEQLRDHVRGKLDAALAEGAVPRVREHPDGFEVALMEMPDVALVDALPIYDEPERATFAASRRPEDDTSGETDGAPRLPAPVDVAADYEAGAVSLRWSPGPGLDEYVASLPRNHRVAYRVYRAVDLAPSELVATVDGATARWRDGELPLTRATLGYEVWTAVLWDDPGGGEPALISAERSDLVTIGVPDHFTMELVGGSNEQAVIRVDLGPSSAPIASREVVLTLGDPLLVADRPSGLVLAELVATTEERLVTRRRLDLRSDGSLNLDPTTRRPRTLETQSLRPVTRLVATLTAPGGGTRTLEVDLP